MKIDVAYIPLKYYDFEYLIYTDVWLQPRLVDYFAIMLDADDKQVDVLFASIGKGSFEICTEFYVMRRNNFSIGFLGSILSFADKLGAHDQEIANERYKSLIPQDRIKIHTLDFVLFLDGSTITWREFYNVRPSLFHANWPIRRNF